MRNVLDRAIYLQDSCKISADKARFLFIIF